MKKKTCKCGGNFIKIPPSNIEYTIIECNKCRDIDIIEKIKYKEGPWKVFLDNPLFTPELRNFLKKAFTRYANLCAMGSAATLSKEEKLELVVLLSLHQAVRYGKGPWSIYIGLPELSWGGGWTEEAIERFKNMNRNLR